MIAQLLPSCVASAFAENAHPEGYLLPEEAAQFGWAVERRRLEFVAGRSCARQALHQLGLPASAILRGRNREPLWPPGVVGSITHCPGYRAAAVALRNNVVTIGIDAELHEKLPPDVLESVSTPEERAWLSRAPTALHWDRLLFSAKESIYKAWFPLTGGWLSFQDAIVTFEPSKASFEAKLLAPPDQSPARHIHGFTGRFLVKNGLVLTAIALCSSTQAKSEQPLS